MSKIDRLDAPFAADKGFICFASMRGDANATFRGPGSEHWRRALEVALAPNKIVWMRTGHTAAVCRAEDATPTTLADAYLTTHPGTLMALPTADCVPVVVVDWRLSRTLLIHAGWKGLSHGVVENGMAELLRAGSSPEDLSIWLAPSIGVNDYEIGEDLSAKLQGIDGFADALVHQGEPARACLDLRRVIVNKMRKLKVPSERIQAFEGSVFADRRFHSARRDGSASGRMVTVAGFPFSSIG